MATLINTPLDSIDTTIFTQAQNMVGEIQFQKTLIQQLELQLIVEPVVESV